MVAWEQHLFQTRVQFENLQQEVYMTTCFATAPLVGILFEVLRIAWLPAI